MLSVTPAEEAVLLANALAGAASLCRHAHPTQSSGGAAWGKAVAVNDSLRLRVFDGGATQAGSSVRLFKAVVDVPYALATVVSEILDFQARLKWDRNIAALEARPFKEVTGPEADAAVAALGGGGGGGGGSSSSSSSPIPPPYYHVFRSATKSVGPISGRDFVDSVYVGPYSVLPEETRLAVGSLYEPLPGAWVNGGGGLAGGHACFPEQTSAFVRGFNFSGCGWLLEPLPHGPSEEGAASPASAASPPLPAGHDGWVRVHYLVQSDLKGWLPSAVVNASLTGMFSTFFGDLFAHMAATRGPKE